jgi:hypothetical protein
MSRTSNHIKSTLYNESIRWSHDVGNFDFESLTTRTHHVWAHLLVTKTPKVRVWQGKLRQRICIRTTPTFTMYRACDRILCVLCFIHHRLLASRHYLYAMFPSHERWLPLSIAGIDLCFLWASWVLCLLLSFGHVLWKLEVSGDAVSSPRHELGLRVLHYKNIVPLRLTKYMSISHQYICKVYYGTKVSSTKT